MLQKHCIAVKYWTFEKTNRVLHVRLLSARPVESAHKLVPDHSQDGDRQAQEGHGWEGRQVRGFGKEPGFGQGRLKVCSWIEDLKVECFWYLKNKLFYCLFTTATNEWLFLYHVFFCMLMMYVIGSLIYNQLIILIILPLLTSANMQLLLVFCCLSVLFFISCNFCFCFIYIHSLF